MRKVYISDLSVEVPNAPEIFKEQFPQGPEVNLGLSKEITALEEENYHELKLKININAKSEDKNIYLVELTQCCIMEIAGVGKEEEDHILNVAVPSMIFPYAAEALTSCINRAGFPPLFLKPINFEILYQQELAEKNADKQNDNTGSDTVQ